MKNTQLSVTATTFTEKTSAAESNHSPLRQIIERSAATKERVHATLLTRRQVAERLGVCGHTVQRLTRKGILRALVFNPRLIRYMPEDVEVLIAQAKVG